MAKKSKTQRAKASARRAERKAAAAAQAQGAVEDSASDAAEEKGALKRSRAEAASKGKSIEKKSAKKGKDVKPAKKDGFFTNVRKELGRVTWPSREDVLRWTGVVVGALVFFSAYVFLLDNFVVTPLLLAISSIGA